MTRSIDAGPTALALLALAVILFGAAAPVAAFSSGGNSGFDSGFGGLEVLCDSAGAGQGDCGQILLPALPAAVPVEFDFDLGVKAIENGLDLRIYSGGDVFVLGSINAIDSITLRSEHIALYGNDLPDTGVSIDPSRLDLREIILDANLTVVSPGGGTYCACVSVVGGGAVSAGAAGDISLSAAGEVVAAVSGAVAKLVDVPGDSSPTPGLWISRDGDIYVDVSMVELNSLSIKAHGAIVVAEAGVMPVPEPGTALLLGLGLVGLGLRRR